ncbi:hypothetical protein R3P38DRAFT_2787158 [Favolaschia claudopus]|uniref:Uncharacterized protein n=1 Tax=Favolaschia claudopus TaxID=2862362 RepID=A0AAW0AP81_9AGAR
MPPKKRPASAAVKSSIPSGSDDNEEDQLKDQDVAGVLEVKYRDPETSQRLLALIFESDIIKQGLFPSTGPNASLSDGGGMPKTEHQWALAKLLLGKDPKYVASIAAAEKDSKMRASYARKIKNRLMISSSSMMRQARKHNTTMGQTGEGIRKASKIDMSKKNAFTTKWAQISQKSSWYFKMQELIGEHPNLVPTGLGNSSSSFDAGVTVLGLTSDDEASAEEEENNDDDETLPRAPHTNTSSPRDSPEPRASRKRSFSKGDVDSEGMVPSKAVETSIFPLSSKRLTEAHICIIAFGAGAGVAANKDEAENEGGGADLDCGAGGADTPEGIDFASFQMRQQTKVVEVKGQVMEKREVRKMRDREARKVEKMQKMKMKELKICQAHELCMTTLTGRSSMPSHTAGFFDTSSHSAHTSGYASSSDYNDHDPLL